MNEAHHHDDTAAKATPDAASQQRKPYQAPRVESVKLTDEAAEALT